MKRVLSALAEFLRRYGAAFAAAWGERASLAAPRRSAQELAFQPAHLELTDTPVSPTARWSARVVIALFCVALVWAFMGQVDIVAIAPGRTVAGSRTKIIQPAETAVVKRILVRDGERVQAGDLLIELDATGTGADVEKAGEALTQARLAALRLQALLRALDKDQPPQIESDGTLPAARLAAEQRLARSQFDAYRARRQGLGASIAQREAELGTVQALIAPLTAAAKIAATRAEDFAKLAQRQHVGRHDYLALEQQRIEAERDLAAQKSRLAELRSAVAAARDEREVLVAEMRRQTLDELRTASEQVQQYSPELAKADRRDSLMQLRAPVAGTVQQLAVHTVGGVVTPAQPLLAVVPSEDGLEIEATVLNKDIGFVRPGQRASVKIDSFPYTRYGYLEATVESVSHDAAQDEKAGLVFPTRVKLASAVLQVDGTAVQLSPGMSLNVEIKTGRRRVIDYLLSPLQSHAQESLRER